MSAGPIWQPPDGFLGGGDAVQERMRVNQLRALRGLPPIDADPTPVPPALSSRLLGRTAPPAYQFNANKPAPPVDTSQQRSVFDQLGEGPSPSWKPLTPVGGALYGLGLAAAEPEAMTPRSVAANAGIGALQALTPQRKDGVQEDVLYPAFHGTNKAFEEYDPSRSQDLGIHFGTLEQAQNRIGFTKGAFDKEKVYSTGANIRPVNVDMDNPVTLPDIFSMGGMMIDTAHEFMRQPQLWFEPEDAAEFEHTASMIDHLEEKAANTQPGMQGTDWNGFTTADRAMHKAYKRAFWNILERTVRDNGYDGVIYSNRAEGPGDSYIAFDPRQVTPRFGGPQPEVPHTVHDPLAKLLYKIKGDVGEEPPAFEGYKIPEIPTTESLLTELAGLSAQTPQTPHHQPTIYNPLYLPESYFSYDEPMTPKAYSLTGDSELQFTGQRGYDLREAARLMDALKWKASGNGSWGAGKPHGNLIYDSPYLTNSDINAYWNAKLMYEKAIGNTAKENGFSSVEIHKTLPPPVNDPQKVQELIGQAYKHFTPWPPQEPQTPIKLQQDWSEKGNYDDWFEKYLKGFDER